MGNFCNSSPALVPRRLSMQDFTLLQYIGKGSFSKVFLIQQHQTNHFFALKIVKKSPPFQAIQSEQEVLCKVSSPFIVKLHHSFHDKRSIYLVLDYAGGGSLLDLLKKHGALNVPQAKFYLAEIVLGLQTLHRNSVLYRDLKPENVLVDLQGHIKLIDFNLAKPTGNTANSFSGTPEYLAPETVLSHQHTVASDFWALGVLGYELLAGSLPFRSTNRTVLYNKILNDSADTHCFPVAAGDLVQQLLHKSCETRMSSFEVLQNHEFFLGFDWELARVRQLVPPFRSTD